MRHSSLLPLLLVLLVGCGARSPLKPIPDGGPPPPPDMGPTLTVDCGRATQFTAPGLPLILNAEAVSSGEVVDTRWEILSGPSGPPPTFTLEPGPAATETTLTPFIEGTYGMRFLATDSFGASASCEVDVESVVGPPVAICPEGPLQATVGETITVLGDAFDDTGLARFLWSVASAPPGTPPRLANPADLELNFTAFTAGRYELLLTVFDVDGASGSCTVAVQVVGPPTIECPAEPIEAPTRRPVTIDVPTTDDVGIDRVEWTLLERPERSAVELNPRDRTSVTFTPDRQGLYLLSYEATNTSGLSSSCEVVVIGTPTPPEVTCPAEVFAVPLVSEDISATAVDDGDVLTWRWELVSRAPGSAAAPPSPANRPDTTFRPDLAGIYILEVTVTDEDGQSDDCTTTVRAGNNDGIRIQMSWDANNTDQDLHLMNPDGTAWFNRTVDCYYANCVGGGGLDWGVGGEPDDNPSLDIDDTNGFGPENTNIFRPDAGTYRVGVHYFGQNGGPRSNEVTIEIFCQDSDTEPRTTIGPVTLNRPRTDFWRVADIEILGNGDCRITELLTDMGDPDITTETDARNNR